MQEARRALKAAQAELKLVRDEAAQAGDRTASAAELEALRAEAADLRTELQEVRETAYSQISDAKQARQAHSSLCCHRYAVTLRRTAYRLPATCLANMRCFLECIRRTHVDGPWEVTTWLKVSHKT